MNIIKALRLREGEGVVRGMVRCPYCNLTLSNTRLLKLHLELDHR